jgi:branched-chain amino acid transport system substrate-binding protein
VVRPIKGIALTSSIQRIISSLMLSCVFVYTVQADIKVGMVLPLSGPLAATGNDIAQGSKAAIDQLNKAGGIKGQRVEMIIEDDRFDAKLSEELSRNMAKTRGVSAFLSCFGTVSCIAVAKVAQESGVPLLGSMAGSEALRDAKQTRVSSVRANAREEVATLLKYSTVINPNNTVVVVQDNGFGKSYANSLQTVASQHSFKPLLQMSFDPKTPNYVDIAKRVVASNSSPAVILIANTLHSVAIIKALSEAKYYGQILNLAGQANGGFVKGLANANQLAVFATVTPSPFGSSSPAAQAYRAHWKSATDNENYSYLGFEAYINAQILLAALKKNSNFTSASVDQAISQLNKVNVYELSYSFAGNHRQAASYTDLAVMSKGSFVH